MIISINSVYIHEAVAEQALAHKIRGLKILELKGMSKFKFGDKFDIKLFHDELLK